MNISAGGYTLIELVIVIALASVLVAAAMTGLGNRNEVARFSTQVEEIKNAIRFAQNEAASGKADGLSSGQSLFGTRLRFSESSYSVDRTADSSTWTAATTVAFPQGITVSPNLTLFFSAPNARYPSVATYTTTFSDIASYDPTDLSQRTSVTLEVRGRPDHRATITVDAFSNRLTSQIIQ